MKRFLILLLSFHILVGCDDDDKKNELTIKYVTVGSSSLNLDGNVNNVSANTEILIGFSASVSSTAVNSAIQLFSSGSAVAFRTLINNDFVRLNLDQPMETNASYTLKVLSGPLGANQEFFAGYEVQFRTLAGSLVVESFNITGAHVGEGTITEVPLNAMIEVTFSAPVDAASATNAVSLSMLSSTDIQTTFSDDNKTLHITTSQPLTHFSPYVVSISNKLQGISGESFGGFSQKFYTQADPTPKFPVISDEDLLTLVQQQTFKYFWDFGHPTSGMARERNSSGDIVTSGGTGFGLMSIIVGIERGFITRSEGIARLTKIVDFLAEADRFHGAWPHWMNGATGAVIPFSPNDNGGDLVETAFLVQGLLTVRQYLDPSIEATLINKINALWNSVEWDWYTRGGEDVLYWHWSPNLDWIMNHQIRGNNETMITYILAASSATHPIDADVYHKGYARSGQIENGNSYYGVALPLGEPYGGPLFFTHYSFLGLDPRNLEDQYANYWTQNVNHTLINRAYVIDNPKNFVGYSEDNWGLTASDNHNGYSAHSPTNDLGVITPTAALSSFPYTPEYSMDALKFFYYTVGDKLWGEYGFYDAYNTTEGWVADSYLAIDQGPIIIMIENYRSGLLWELFMSAPEVQSGLDKLGFTY